MGGRRAKRLTWPCGAVSVLAVAALCGPASGQTADSPAYVPNVEGYYASTAGGARQPGRAPPAEAVAAAPSPRLPHRVLEAASAYEAFIRRTSAIDADFRSGAAVADAVKRGASYESGQFLEGAIAYAALTALQEPSFAQGVRRLSREGGQGLADRLAADPQAVLGIPGADVAAARAATALRRHGERLVNAGMQVKRAAYTVQHADWSKDEVSDPDGRLAAAKVASAAHAGLKSDDAPELTRAVLAETPGDGPAASTSVVNQGVALAALVVLGQLQGDDDARLSTLLQDHAGGACLKMAKLNLFQCLSVARPHYEDIFCLGEHGMMETGQCVVKAAGYTPIPPPPPFAVASAAGSSR